MAHLKLEQLTQKQEFLRQEEETKLKLDVLEALYEVQKTDLQVELFQDEDIDYPNFPEVLKEQNPIISRKTLSPEADRNQLNPKVQSHS